MSLRYNYMLLDALKKEHTYQNRKTTIKWIIDLLRFGVILFELVRHSLRHTIHMHQIPMLAQTILNGPDTTIGGMLFNSFTSIDIGLAILLVSNQIFSLTLFRCIRLIVPPNTFWKTLIEKFRSMLATPNVVVGKKACFYIWFGCDCNKSINAVIHVICFLELLSCHRKITVDHQTGLDILFFRRSGFPSLYMISLVKLETCMHSFFYEK